MVECWTVSRGNWGSKPPAAISKLGQFCSVCLSEETLKAVLSVIRGSNRSNTGKWKRDCCGLTNLVKDTPK